MLNLFYTEAAVMMANTGVICIRLPINVNLVYDYETHFGVLQVPHALAFHPANIAKVRVKINISCVFYTEKNDI